MCMSDQDGLGGGGAQKHTHRGRGRPHTGNVYTIEV